MMFKILNTPEATIIPCCHEETGLIGLFNTITNEFYPVEVPADWTIKVGWPKEDGEGA